MAVRTTFSLLLLVTLTACGSEPEQVLFTVRDSAGIEIVLSDAPAWGEEEPWTLDSGPLLRIGVTEGDPRYVLDRVRSPFRTSDGRIVIPNTISKVLRVYSVDGEHLIDFGGEGDGPGELRDFEQAWRVRGDSIAVYDLRTSSVNLWDSSGRFGRRTRVRTQAYVYVFLGVLADGSFIAGDGSLNPAPTPSASTRDSTHLFSYRADGTLKDSIAWAAGFIRFNRSPTPFSPRFHWGIADSLFYIAEGERHEVKQFGTARFPHRLVRWREPNRPVTSAEVAVIEDALEARYEGDRLVEQRRTLAEAPRPEALPALAGILVDELGYLWVRRYDVQRDNMWTGRMSATSSPSKWRVFDPSGIWLGDVQLPANLEVAEVGRDWVLGIERDEFDVPQVVMYRLHRERVEGAT